MEQPPEKVLIMKPTPRLQCKKISLEFRSVSALIEVDFAVFDKSILAIIGPNGAGKSSLLNCISGFYTPSRGEILFEERDITKLPPRKRAALGVSRTFQNVELFPGMTSLDNILAGRQVHMKTNFVQSMLYWPWAIREENKHREVAEEIIEFLEIESIRNSIVSSLGYGMRKRVDLGRALAMGPKILMLDEPMAGMNVEEKEDMARFILDIRTEKGIPIIIIEHDMEVVMDISDRIVVLEWGRVIAEGTPESIRSNPKVVNAYLGEG